MIKYNYLVDYEERMGGMLKQTNMKKIEEVAKMFLAVDIVPDKEFPFIIHHPFFNSPFVPCMFDFDTEETMANLNTKEGQMSARKHMLKVIDMIGSYQGFLTIIMKPYLPTFFKHTKDFVSKKDYSEFLAQMWILVEFVNSDTEITPKDFIEIFKEADKKYLMEKEELDIYKSLPDEVVIYRGVKPNSSTKALSWSLNKETAQWFADRFEENGKVYSAKIKKKDVLAYFDGRKEQEVVVDFTKLYDITEL